MTRPCIDCGAAVILPRDGVAICDRCKMGSTYMLGWALLGMFAVLAIGGAVLLAQMGP